MNEDSMLEMVDLAPFQAIREPAQPSIESLMPLAIHPPTRATSVHLDSLLPLATSAMSTIPSENELKTMPNPFTLPFHTIVAKSLTTSTVARLYVRRSTLLKVPFFKSKLATGELRSEEEYYMLDDSDDATSLGLLLGFVENNEVPTLVPEMSVIDQELATGYVRIYPLAGKLGLEKIQNSVVDCLIKHYLDHAVLAESISILVKAGVTESKFARLLVQELARGIIDGRYTSRIQQTDTEYVGSTTGHLTREDQKASTHCPDESGIHSVFGSSTHHDYVPDNLDDISQSRTCDPCPEIPLSSPQKLSYRLARATSSDISPAILVPKSTIITSSIKPFMLQEIQRSWRVRDCTSLIAMMAEAHDQAQNPTNRSPMELAAADPCKFHMNTMTAHCFKPQTTRGRKRRRQSDEWDESDRSGDENEENDVEHHGGDGVSDVQQSHPHIIKLDGKTRVRDRSVSKGKENADPTKGDKIYSGKEEKDQQPAKRRRLSWYQWFR